MGELRRLLRVVACDHCIEAAQSQHAHRCHSGHRAFLFSSSNSPQARPGLGREQACLRESQLPRAGRILTWCFNHHVDEVRHELVTVRCKKLRQQVLTKHIYASPRAR